VNSHLIFDTNIIIDSIRGKKDALRCLEDVGLLVLSVMSVLELLDGCRNLKEIALVDDFIDRCRVIRLNDKICDLGVEIFKEGKLKKGIGIGDSLIAATALIHNFTLVTLNIKHFKFIKGLKVIKPY